MHGGPHRRCVCGSDEFYSKWSTSSEGAWQWTAVAGATSSQGALGGDPLGSFVGGGDNENYSDLDWGLFAATKVRFLRGAVCKRCRRARGVAPVRELVVGATRFDVQAGLCSLAVSGYFNAGGLQLHIIGAEDASGPLELSASGSPFFEGGIDWIDPVQIDSDEPESGALKSDRVLEAALPSLVPGSYRVFLGDPVSGLRVIVRELEVP